MMRNLHSSVAMRVVITAALFAVGVLAQEAVHPVFPTKNDAAANRFRSPAIDAGDYVYISGQGPRAADGTMPTSFDAQVKQTLENVKAILDSAHLSIEHVVYMQVYMEDMTKFRDLNEAFVDFFGKAQPARAVLGVARVPESPVEINAVAVRNLSEKKPVYPSNWKSNDPAPPAVLTHDRLFISGMPGSDPATGQVPEDPATQVDFALNRMEAVVKAVGLDLKNVVFVNPYLTQEIPSRVMNEHYARRFEFGNTPARATIEVSSLPEGAHIEYTAVAVKDLAQRRAIRPKNMPPSPTASPCVFAGDTLYCSAKDGFIPGPHGGVYATTTPHQLRQTMRNLLDNLEEADMKFSQVVATNVYLDNLSDLSAFNDVYAEYFGSTLPARTAAQQIAPTERKPDKDGHFPGLEQVSFIAVRNRVEQ